MNFAFFSTRTRAVAAALLLSLVFAPTIAMAAPVISGLSATRLALTPGQALTHSVTASGSGTLGYQWSRNGHPIAGATGSALSIAGVTYQDAGYYLVDVTDTTGTTRSAPMFVLVAPASTQVRAWGDSDHQVQTSVPNDLYDAVAIAAGGGASLALRRDGTVVGWGDITNGVVVVPAGLSDVVAISAGSQEALALKSNGTVVIWGQNAFGQSPPPPPTGLTGVVGIATGADHSFALKSDGTVVGWGGPSGLASIPADLSNVVSISTKNASALAIKTDGTVVEWGVSMVLGDNPLPAGLTNLTAISAGYMSHVLALKSDQTVVAWGNNYTDSPVVPSGLNNVVAIAAGVGQSLALKSDGTVVGWGSNSAEIVPADLTNVLAISSSYGFCVALRETAGDVAPTVSSPPVSLVAAETHHVTLAVTADGSQPLHFQWRKNGVNVAGATDSALNFGEVAVSDAGIYDVVITNQAGSVTSATATLTVNPVPRVTSLSSPRQVLRPGERLELAVTATGSGPLNYQWIHDGKSIAGAMGSGFSITSSTRNDSGWYEVLITDNFGTRRSTAIFVNVIPVTTGITLWGDISSGVATVPNGLNDAIAVAAGVHHVLALKRDGTVVAWGDNSYGQSTVPSGLTNVVRIAAAGNLSMALKSDGTVSEWGRDPGNYGQFGAPEGLRSVVAIAVSPDCSMAVKDDGTVVIWKFVPGGIKTTIPAEFAGVSDVAVASIYAQYGLRGDGTLLSWLNGALAPDGPFAHRSDLRSVAAGGMRVLALTNDGTVLEVGRYLSGSDARSPVGLTSVAAIAAGDDYSLALKNDGTVVAWGGSNYYRDATPPGLNNVLAIAAGASLSIALNDTEHPPVLNLQPVNHTATPGQTAAFAVGTTESPGSDGYQWQRMAAGGSIWVNLSDGGNFSGTGTATLLITNSDLTMNGDQFRCLVTNGFGSTTSGAAILSATIPVTWARQVLLMNRTSAGAAISLGNVDPAWRMAVSGDFDGDGIADIIWQNSVTGQHTLWLMNGTAHGSTVDLGTTDPSWQMAGTGDFNGDGQIDILWQNTVTGQHSIWLMWGTVNIDYVDLGTTDPTWQMVGTGDFNGDDQTDILWQNIVTGQHSIWLMQGTVSVGNIELGTTDPTWQMKGTGDFNGDGQTDILWQNTVSGQMSLWLLYGTTVIGGADFGTADPSWQVAGVIDFDGDGKIDVLQQKRTALQNDFNGDGQTDLLWQNNSTGVHQLWLMHGATNLGTVDLGTTELNWQIAGTGDFNGDGQIDILWHNLKTGQHSVWLMHGTMYTGGVELETTDPAWQVRGTGDFNGDGWIDILLQNTLTGQCSIWLMTGTTHSATVNMGTFDPAWQIVVGGDFNADGHTDILWQNIWTGEHNLWLMTGSVHTGTVDLSITGALWQMAGIGDFNADGSIDILWQNTATGQHSVWLMHGTTNIGNIELGTTDPAWVIVN